eukprot:6469103-Amphidinium_carterae.1
MSVVGTTVRAAERQTLASLSIHTLGNCGLLANCFARLLEHGVRESGIAFHCDEAAKSTCAGSDQSRCLSMNTSAPFARTCRANLRISRYTK